MPRVRHQDRSLSSSSISENSRVFAVMHKRKAPCGTSLSWVGLVAHDFIVGVAAAQHSSLAGLLLAPLFGVRIRIHHADFTG